MKLGAKFFRLAADCNLAGYRALRIDLHAAATVNARPSCFFKSNLWYGGHTEPIWTVWWASLFVTGPVMVLFFSSGDRLARELKVTILQHKHGASPAMSGEIS